MASMEQCPSRHERIAAFMTSQQMQSLAKDLCEIKPASTLSWKEKGLRNSPLAEELLSTDGCQGQDNQFSVGMWSLLVGTNSSGWPHIHEYKGSTNWTQWDIYLYTNTYMYEMKLEWGRARVDLEGVREEQEVNMIKTLNSIRNSQRILY